MLKYWWLLPLGFYPSNFFMEFQLPEISIIIVGYHSKRYLESCLKSVRHQTIYKPSRIEVFFINNGSFDGSISYLQRHYKWVNTVRNLKNLGYPASLNQGVTYASGDFILIMNADTILEKDYLEKALELVKKDNQISALMGKIYRYDFNRSLKTSKFYSVGTHVFVDREILTARGAPDLGQFENTHEIFSVSNKCALYRKRALEDIKVDDEYFDEDFFLQLEDRDACWRLQLYGWKVMYHPELIAYHCTDNRKVAQIEIYKQREKEFMLKNERLMTIKNEYLLNLLKDFHLIFMKRWRKKGFFWKGKYDYVRQMPKALKKRRIIMKKKRTRRVEMRKWFIKKRSIRYNVYKSKNLKTYAKLPPIY